MVCLKLVLIQLRNKIRFGGLKVIYSNI